MKRLTRTITKTLSLRITLMIVLAIATLLTVALFIVFRYSRSAMRNEALQKAEMTVEATVQQIDNIFLTVEQSAGNIYWNMLLHVNDPEKLFLYSRKLVETNPYITGAAIAMEPYYFKERGHYFMAYVHRTSSDSLAMTDAPIIQAETFGNKPYNEQVWYTQAIQKGAPCWINPMKDDDTDAEPIITFSLPIYNRQGKPCGVMGVDVSLTLLSNIVLSAKPSPNSYATLLGSDGSYIIHPDSNKLYHHSVFTLNHKDATPEMLEVAQSMMAGQQGFSRLHINDTDCFVFYKPFRRSAVPGRSMSETGWSVAMVYPEADIFLDYNRLLYLVLLIAVVSLVLLAIFCQVITHRQLLPLRMLTSSAQRIAEGHFDDTIPDSRQQDEVGRLQDHFQQMQKALANNMGELKRLTIKLKEHGEELSTAYEQAKEADRMKTSFLHNMTNQMTTPVNAISKSVELLSQSGEESQQVDKKQLVDDIQQQGKTITDLLNDLLKLSLEELNHKK